MYSRLALWAASPVADAVSREVPKAVEEHEIAEIIAGFAAAAARCAEGGFDGVELECSGASILSGFLSPATNLRTDGYGGSLERRARLLLEILSEVRSAVGRKLAIGVRLSGDERVDPGTTLTDAIAVEMVDEQGCADYLNASVGPVKTTPQVSGSPRHVGPRHSSLIAAAFRKAIALPVVGGGRYRDPGPGRACAQGRSLRSRRDRAGPDHRPPIRLQGALRPHRDDRSLLLVHPGVRGPRPP